MTAISKHDFSLLDWYVLRVVTFLEIEICHKLLEFGYNAFCPYLYRLKRSRSSQAKEKVAEALYQGYLFCGFNENPSWDKLFGRGKNSTTGVVGVLGNNGTPCTVSYNKMLMVFHQCGSVAAGPIHRGSIIEIVGGHLDGQRGQVEELSPGRASFTLSTNQQKVSMPVDSLRVVS